MASKKKLIWILGLGISVIFLVRFLTFEFSNTRDNKNPKMKAEMIQTALLWGGLKSLPDLAAPSAHECNGSNPKWPN